MKRAIVLALLLLLVACSSNDDSSNSVTNDDFTLSIPVTRNHGGIDAKFTKDWTRIVDVKTDPFRTGLNISDNPVKFDESEWLGDYWIKYENGTYLYYVPQICRLINITDYPVAGSTYIVDTYHVKGELIRDIFGDEIRPPIDTYISCFKAMGEAVDSECEYGDVEVMFRFPTKEFENKDLAHVNLTYHRLVFDAVHHYRSQCSEDLIQEGNFTGTLMGHLQSPGCVDEVEWFPYDPELKVLVEAKGYKTYQKIVMPCWDGVYFDFYCGENKEECNCGFKGMDLVCGGE